MGNLQHVEINHKNPPTFTTCVQLSPLTVQNQHILALLQKTILKLSEIELFQQNAKYSSTLTQFMALLQELNSTSPHTLNCPGIKHHHTSCSKIIATRLWLNCEWIGSHVGRPRFQSSDCPGKKKGSVHAGYKWKVVNQNVLESSCCSLYSIVKNAYSSSLQQV